MITSAISFSARPQIFSRLAHNTATSLKEVRELSITAMLVIALAGANLSLWSPEALSLLTTFCLSQRLANHHFTHAKIHASRDQRICLVQYFI